MPMIALASAYLSPSTLPSVKLRLIKLPSSFSTSVSNLKPLYSHEKASSYQKRVRNVLCRAELGIDVPFATAIGACILSSLILPVTSSSTDDESEAIMDSIDTRFAVMSIISFIPYFNWLGWVFAWLDSGNRRYAVYALAYLAPYLRSNLSLSPEESWLPIASIVLCIFHVQLEVSIRNGDFEGFQIFGETSKQISSITKGRNRSKGSNRPSNERKKDHTNLPSAKEASRDEIGSWGASKRKLDDQERSGGDWNGDDERRRK